MTENEKAGTFIGWKPEHDIPAPDMTNPRNYMKALRGLPPKYRWSAGNAFMRGGDLSPEQPPVERWHIWTVDRVPFNSHFKESPVAALAALYDAERAVDKG